MIRFFIIFLSERTEVCIWWTLYNPKAMGED